MQYEELLTKISKTGVVYRWIITTLVSAVSMKFAYNMFIMNLATSSVPFHCDRALVDNKSVPLAEVLSNLTIVGNFSALDYTCSVPRFRTGPGGFINLVNDTSSNETEECASWTFLPDHPERWTIFIEYQMVCNRTYLSNRLQTVLQIGICISTLFGPLGDIFGRKPFFLLFAYIDLACYIVLVVVKDLTLQMVFTFFMGFGAQSSLIGLILTTEVVSEEYRGMHGNLIWVAYVIGYSSSAAIGFYILNWRTQMIVVSVIIGILYVAYIPVIPESPRWLLTRGQTKRAKKVLKEMCRFSGCKEAIENFNVDDNEVVHATQEEETNCIFKLIPRENLCRIEYFVTIGIVTFVFFTVALVYLALSFQRDFITRNVYLNVLLSGLLELPAYILAWQLTNRIGRKLTTCISLGLCGMGLIVLPYVPVNPQITFQGASVLAIAVKFSVTVAYSVFAVFGSEVLPTKVRSCSFFFACFLMGGGMILAPEMGSALASVYENLPYLMYGGVSVLASLSILLLPETKDRPLPNTVAEMESLGCSLGCVASEEGVARGGSGGVAAAAEELKPLEA